MIWRLHTTTHAPQSTKTKNKHPHVHARESKKVWILLTRPVSLLNRGFLFSRYGPRGRPSARAPFCVRCSRPHATPAELGKSTIDRVRIACDVASCAVPIIHTNLIVLTTDRPTLVLTEDIFFGLVLLSYAQRKIYKYWPSPVLNELWVYLTKGQWDWPWIRLSNVLPGTSPRRGILIHFLIIEPLYADCKYQI